MQLEPEFFMDTGMWELNGFKAKTLRELKKNFSKDEFKDYYPDGYNVKIEWPTYEGDSNRAWLRGYTDQSAYRGKNKSIFRRTNGKLETTLDEKIAKRGVSKQDLREKRKLEKLVASCANIEPFTGRVFMTQLKGDKKRNRFTDECTQYIVEKRSEGLSCNQIAYLTGTTFAQVYRRLCHLRGLRSSRTIQPGERLHTFEKKWGNFKNYSTWKKESDDFLREKKEAGWSSGEIAVAMGITRNMVQGRWHRLNGYGKKRQQINHVMAESYGEH